MDYTNVIERNPEILQGKPVIKGSRISVELIVRKMAGGFTIQQIIESYPQLTVMQVRAALEYAADLIANEEVEEMV